MSDTILRDFCRSWLEWVERGATDGFAAPRARQIAAAIAQIDALTKEP